MDEGITGAIQDAKKILVDAFCADPQKLFAQGPSLDREVQDVVRQLARGVVEDVLETMRVELLDTRPEPNLTIEHHRTVSFTCLFGTITVRSPYLTNRDNKGGEGWRPMKEVFGIVGKGCSPAVARALSDFGSDRSYQDAEDAFAEHYGFVIGRTTIRSNTLAEGERALTYVEERLEDVVATGHPEQTEMVVQLDGCHVRTGELMTAGRVGTLDRPPTDVVRVEQWRETRTGLVRGLDDVEPTYVCRIADYDTLTEQLHAAAQARGLTTETTVIAPSDGGNGLKEALERRFDNLHFILDYPHFKEQLYETADALGVGEEVRMHWIDTLTERVRDGEIDEVLCDLHVLYGLSQEHRVLRLFHHLERFASCLHYDEYVRRGWPIGSGEVESAHRYLPQARLKIAGACWRVENINPMLALRLLKINGWWEDYWAEDTHRHAA